jgi:hypothetical protein
MNSRLRVRINGLRQLILQIWRAAEHAEGDVLALNDFAQHLAAIGIIPDCAILGKLILDRSYGPSDEERNTCQVWQATVLLPDGFGALVWDSDEYLDLPRDYELTIQEARWHFVPFSECPPVVRALLVEHLETLFEETFDLVSMRRRWLEPLAKSIPCKSD